MSPRRLLQFGISSAQTVDSDDMCTNLASPVSSASSRSPTPVQTEKEKGKAKKEDGTKENKQKKDSSTATQTLEIFCRQKRQLSPQSKSSSKVTSVPGKASDASTATSTGTRSGKMSTLLRREEPLKQLKAVEDAIARKRAKIPGKV